MPKRLAEGYLCVAHCPQGTAAQATCSGIPCWTFISGLISPVFIVIFPPESSNMSTSYRPTHSYLPSCSVCLHAPFHSLTTLRGIIYSHFLLCFKFCKHLYGAVCQFLPWWGYSGCKGKMALQKLHGHPLPASNSDKCEL